MKHQAMNPYLPLYEYIPDGEPRIFGEPALSLRQPRQSRLVPVLRRQLRGVERPTGRPGRLAV